MKKIEIFLKNILLNFLLYFSRSKRNQDAKSPEEFSRIMFIRLNRIGDALVTTPLLHLIKQKTNARLYVLCGKKNKDAYQNNKDIDEIIIFDKGINGIFRVLRFIKENQIDCLVDLHDDVSTTVSFILALAKTKYKFALEKENKKIYTGTIPKLNPAKSHIVERLLEIAKLFGIKDIDYSNVRINYKPKESSLDEAKSFVKNNFEKHNFLIGVNISAGSDARFWGIERFKKLLDFLSKFDINILILSAPKDLEEANAISNSFEVNGLQKSKVFCNNEFDLFASIISQIDLLFTPDTMAVHLASAFNKPVFGVYVKYKTNDMIWSPYNTKFDYVVTEEPTLDNVSYEQVIAKFKPFLEKSLAEYSGK
jgi:ADP-heptose:LPS heptosyltransferase